MTTNLTDTTSMSYNGYKQRSFLNQSNNKRTKAIDNLMDIQSTKYAILYWSHPTDIDVTVTRPGGSNTDDAPGDQAINPFKAGVIDLSPTVGYNKVYKPKNVLNDVFSLVDDAGTGSGLNQIKYIGTDNQLVEIKATILPLASATEIKPVLSVQKNGKLINADYVVMSVIDGGGADAATSNMELTFQTKLVPNDLIKLAVWKLDSTTGSTVTVGFKCVSLKVSTLP